METRPLKKFSFFSLLIVFLLLTFWTLETGSIQVSALQVEETHTPTYTPPEENSQTNTTEPESPPPSPTATEDAPPATKPLPLPAIFNTGVYIPDELIVRFKPSTRATVIKQCFQNIDVKVISEIEEIRTMVLRVSAGNLGNTYRHVLSCAGVLYVEPNFFLQAADKIPNDPNWNLQYGLVNIRAPQGWDLATGSAAVTIAIVDSGVDQSHREFAGKLVAGYDFVNNDSDPQDDYGHGTHVAGIAAASSNNGVGVAGVSWGARIMPVKVLNSAGGGSYANTAAGVIWAVDHGAQVINMSLGGGSPSSVLEDAVNYAHNKGAVVVASAGNGGSNFVLYPARFANVIAVASTDSANNWSGSNYGPEVDLAAPGNLIYSTEIGGYGYKSGSSMASAFTSGLAAVLRGIQGNTSPDTIELQMESTALDIEFNGWDEYTGAGLIQMDGAIKQAIPPAAPSKKPGTSPSVGGNIPVQITYTSPPLSTWTASATQTVQNAIATFTPETESSIQITYTATNTSVLDEENEVKAQQHGLSTYLLPFAGALLILLGLLSAWIIRRRQRKNAHNIKLNIGP